MVGRNQDMFINERVRNVVTTFITTDMTIKEVAEALKLSFSTVQRDLNDLERIENIFGSTKRELILKAIKKKLDINKKRGRALGGTNSTFNNVSTRDENGKFNGNHKIR